MRTIAWNHGQDPWHSLAHSTPHSLLTHSSLLHHAIRESRNLPPSTCGDKSVIQTTKTHRSWRTTLWTDPCQLPVELDESWLPCLLLITFPLTVHCPPSTATVCSICEHLERSPFHTAATSASVLPNNMFYGDFCPTKKPLTFLTSLKEGLADWPHLSDSKKCEYFYLNCWSGFEAEAWYKNFTSSITMSWATLVLHSHIKWPGANPKLLLKVPEIPPTFCTAMMMLTTIGCNNVSRHLLPPTTSSQPNNAPTMPKPTMATFTSEMMPKATKLHSTTLFSNPNLFKWLSTSQSPMTSLTWAHMSPCEVSTPIMNPPPLVYVPMAPIPTKPHTNCWRNDARHDHSEERGHRGGQSRDTGDQKGSGCSVEERESRVEHGMAKANHMNKVHGAETSEDEGGVNELEEQPQREGTWAPVTHRWGIRWLGWYAQGTQIQWWWWCMWTQTCHQQHRWTPGPMSDPPHCPHTHHQQCDTQHQPIMSTHCACWTTTTPHWHPHPYGWIGQWKLMSPLVSTLLHRTPCSPYPAIPPLFCLLHPLSTPIWWNTKSCQCHTHQSCSHQNWPWWCHVHLHHTSHLSWPHPH